MGGGGLQLAMEGGPFASLGPRGGKSREGESRLLTLLGSFDHDPKDPVVCDLILWSGWPVKVLEIRGSDPRSTGDHDTRAHTGSLVDQGGQLIWVSLGATWHTSEGQQWEYINQLPSQTFIFPFLSLSTSLGISIPLFTLSLLSNPPPLIVTPNILDHP